MKRKGFLVAFAAFFLLMTSACASAETPPEYKTRILTVLYSAQKLDLFSLSAAVFASMADFYWRPNVSLGVLDYFLFTHFAAFLAIYTVLGLIIKHAFEKMTFLFKLVYIIFLPLLALALTLFLPSV